MTAMPIQDRTENDELERRFCVGNTKTGERCRSRMIGASGFCIAHDPERRAEFRQISATGGRNRRNPEPSTRPLSEDPEIGELDLTTTGGLLGLLSVTLRRLSDLPFNVRVAHCIASVAFAQRATIEADSFRGQPPVSVVPSPGRIRALQTHANAVLRNPAE